MVARFSEMFSSIGGFPDEINHVPSLPPPDSRGDLRGKEREIRALVGRVGIEPTTPGLKVRCSAS